MENLIGQTIADRYRIDEFLGRGGMAEVYKIWDSQRGVELALKMLHEDLALDRVFLRRFKREAQTLSKLQHPNIVRFYGLEIKDRQAYMLLDYVSGESLKHKIYDNPYPMDLQEIQRIMRSLCSALGYAHQEGLIHCDLKPGNVLFTADGTAVLSDFGIARLTDAATATMVGAGTPAYMAPEQVKGLDPVLQTDIYALGVILFEMLTGGERPFTGETATATGTTSAKVRWEQVNVEPPSPRLYNPEISHELEANVLKCLAKNPEDRYKTAFDLLNAIEQDVNFGAQTKQAAPDSLPVKKRDYPSQEPDFERELEKKYPEERSTIKRSKLWGGWIGAGGILIVVLIIMFIRGKGDLYIPGVTSKNIEFPTTWTPGPTAALFIFPATWTPTPTPTITNTPTASPVPPTSVPYVLAVDDYYFIQKCSRWQKIKLYVLGNDLFENDTIDEIILVHDVYYLDNDGKKVERNTREDGTYAVFPYLNVDLSQHEVERNGDAIDPENDFYFIDYQVKGSSGLLSGVVTVTMKIEEPMSSSWCRDVFARTGVYHVVERVDGFD